MAEVLFYHLTESRLEDALPPLLEKSLDRGWLVSVHLCSEERRTALDAHLWTF
ncbi:MAG: DNA polymerase III subunit chi, partial [Hoeflea sp.]|nr:DNA polymerase III subunit chi [Hoeflea sp.]